MKTKRQRHGTPWKLILGECSEGYKLLRVLNKILKTKRITNNFVFLLRVNHSAIEFRETSRVSVPYRMKRIRFIVMDLLTPSMVTPFTYLLSQVSLHATHECLKVKSFSCTCVRARSAS